MLATHLDTKSSNTMELNSPRNQSPSLNSVNSSPETSLFRNHRGSLRKKLPSVPDIDTQISMSAKMIDTRTCTPKGNHSYGPVFQEYSLLAEYNLLREYHIPGIYVIPSSSNILQWFGVIFVRHGMYLGGIFRFKILIPEHFPDGDCPRVVFDHLIFHPSIDPHTNELDVIYRFKKWKRNVNHIWQILHYTRSIFNKNYLKNVLNTEAANMYETDRKAFHEKVLECIKDWRDRIYVNDSEDSKDPHYITFTPYDPQLHGEFLKAIKNVEDFNKMTKVEGNIPTGYSFMQSGTLNIFSKVSSSSS